MTRAAKNVPMCIVTLGGHMELLLPSAQGLKMIQLLESAFHVRTDYQSHYRERKFIVGEQVKVEYSGVTAKQLVPEKVPGMEGRTLALTNDR